MQIRKATQADVHSIANIHTTSWQKNYSQVLTPHYLNSIAPAEREAIWHDRLSAPKTNQEVFVAEINNVVIGFACIYLEANAEFGSYLDNLHVVSEHQGKGVGKSLLRAVAIVCTELAPGSGLCLLVNQTNTRAQDFYLKLGAQNVREDFWAAPDESLVPTYWFVWRDLYLLVNS
ncbi:MAG TPA: GNAT family N-acetyltransferase [Cellvibrionaceae bacterium]